MNTHYWNGPPEEKRKFTAEQHAGYLRELALQITQECDRAGETDRIMLKHQARKLAKRANIIAEHLEGGGDQT